jgi:hypothetical protein
VTPSSERTPPASTIPATFAGADTSRTSSSMPTAKITAAPSTTASGSDDPWKTLSNPESCDATPMATRKAMNMAAPPSVGVGTVWTRRSSGPTTAPTRIAIRRTRGVVMKVTVAATAKAMP